MRKVVIYAILFFLVAPEYSASQELKYLYNSRDLSISLQANYISSASIQLHAFSQSEIERNIFQEISGGYGYSAVIRKKFYPDNISLALSVEHIIITDDQNSIFLESEGPSLRVRVTETIEVIPVEFSGIFNIPYFSEDLNIYLGGGIGLYFGDWKRKILDFETETISKDTRLNFHILSGVDYFISRNVSAGFEMRFREAMFVVNNEFPVNEFVRNGYKYAFQKSYNSKVFVDGLKLSLGLSYYF